MVLVCLKGKFENWFLLRLIVEIDYNLLLIDFVVIF